MQFPPVRPRGLLTLAGSVKILLGDVREQLRLLPDESVHCMVTSPPYYNLRRYDGGDKQIGLEASVDAYVQAMVDVFREIRRVLRHDGTAWLVIGDSYASMTSGYGHGSQSEIQSGTRGVDHVPAKRKDVAAKRRDHKTSTLQYGRIPKENKYFLPEVPTTGTSGSFLKPKDLCMVPARVALALQADGWWLRNDAIWHKPTCIPESMADRMTSSHEHIFFLAKSERYYYDNEAVREEPKPWTQATLRASSGVLLTEESQQHEHAGTRVYEDLKGANRRDVWTISPTTVPTPEDHPAMFPIEIPMLAIQAGTSEMGCCPTCNTPWARVRKDRQSWAQNTKASRSRPDGRAMFDSRYRDGLAQPGIKEFRPQCKCDPPLPPVPCVVLDPFGGAGTTGLAAAMLGRNCVLVELSEKYAKGIVARMHREDVRAEIVTTFASEDNSVVLHDVDGIIPVKKQRSKKAKFIDCPRCDGSGFSGRGTGYDDVCSECGGQKRFPVQDAPPTQPAKRKKSDGTRKTTDLFTGSD